MTASTSTQNVGGTSGSAASSGNVLSLNLGGLDVNYDLGPSTANMAASAYNYLGTSMTADSALLGNTILGSQNFLSGIVAPVESMAQNQQSFNTQQLPAMFSTLTGQNYQLGEEAVNADTQVAQASIASSNASAQESRSASSGFCYITSAVCETFGKPDDCFELTCLRHFRDTYMSQTPQRRAEVEEYYAQAPALVSAILLMDDARYFLARLYAHFITPALQFIELGQFENARIVYRHMVRHVRSVVK
jgi:hypothetical protein